MEGGIQLSTANGESMNADAATATVRYARARPWTDQWWVALWWQFQVESVYKGASLQPANTSTYKLIVYEACLAITHVADWVQNDKANPLAESDVKQIVNGSSFIRIAFDVANTAKHHTRGSKTAPTAQVEEVKISADANGAPIRSLTILWNDGKGASQTFDAQTIVNYAIDEWRGQFVVHGIQDPFPDGI